MSAPRDHSWPPSRRSPSRRWATLICTLVMLLVGAARPSSAQTARVEEIIDGDTLTLAAAIDGAREVRLVGIQAPKLPLGRKDFKTWPLADEAQAALDRLARGRTVALIFTGRQRDRHDRILAHLQRDDGLWLQGEMLRLGLARVYTFADNRGRAQEMLAIEGRARADGAGIWRHPFYRIRTADALDDAEIGMFQLVEGTITAAQRVKSRIYLNFGADWRSDFTVVIAASAVPMFEAAGIDPLAMQGRRVRVRGWLDRYNGPMIEATHPEQIEMLPPAADR